MATTERPSFQADVEDDENLLEPPIFNLKKIESQLSRCKKRDLNASHQRRVLYGSSNTYKSTRRFITFDSTQKDFELNKAILDDDTSFPYYYAHVPKTVEQIEQDAIHQEKEAQKHSQWIVDRMKLRKDMKNSSLLLPWLKKKPDKSVVECRVMNQLHFQQKKKLFQKKKFLHLNGKVEIGEIQEVKTPKKTTEKKASNVSISPQTKNQTINGADHLQLPNKSFKSTQRFIDSKQSLSGLKVGGREQALRKSYSESYSLNYNKNKLKVPNDLINYKSFMSFVPKDDVIKEKKVTKEETSSKYSSNFPFEAETAPLQEEMKLSTGKAQIRRKVNCWLSLEDYEKFSKNNLHKKKANIYAKQNAFWPGSEKQVLYYAENEKKMNSKAFAIFDKSIADKVTNFGYDNDLNVWPFVGDYVKYGDITKGKSYVIGHR